MNHYVPTFQTLTLNFHLFLHRHVRTRPLPREGKAPVLMFGSAFRDPNMYTTMIAMPMPQREHLYCFENWVEVGGRYACKELRQDLPFGVEGSDGWDDLIVSSF